MLPKAIAFMTQGEPGPLKTQIAQVKMIATNAMKCQLPGPYIEANMQINGLKTPTPAEWF